MMDLLSDNPKLGHITTFGAPCHCVSLFSYITETDLMDRTLDKKLFKSLLVHPLIQEVRGKGIDASRNDIMQQ
jgi:hypothetical protein